MNNKNNLPRAIQVAHFVMFVVCMFVFTILFFKHIDKNTANIISSVPQKTLDWFDLSDRSFGDLMHLDEYDDENLKGSVYTKLPKLSGVESLCFRANHIYFSVYVDDKLVYAPVYHDSVFYTKSTGSYWQTIPLNSEYSGKTLEIRYQLAYDESSAGFDTIYLMSASDYRYHIMSKRLVSFILTIIYFALACIIIVLDLLISKTVDLQKELFYLGFLTLHVALYSLCQLQVLSLYFSDFRYEHMFEVMILSFLPLSTSCYARFKFPFKNTKLSDIQITVCTIICITTFFLNFTGILDYHESLPLTHFSLVVAIISITATMISTIMKNKQSSEKLDGYSFSIVIGLGVLTCCAFIDIVRYWVQLVNDDLLIVTRFGFLGFIGCFSVASSKKIIDAFKNSTVTAFISDLAYKDALTKLGNRTAYEEKLKEYQQRYIDFGIVMCDVNNLKMINDFQGHELGDELIKNCGRLIREAFDMPGADVYRIGGDEFVVLVVTENIFKDCANGVKKLEDLYADFNKGEHPYKIIIAKGFAKHTAKGWSTVEQSIKSADDKMYENKKFLKEQANMEAGNSVGNVRKAVDEAVKLNFRRRNDL